MRQATALQALDWVLHLKSVETQSRGSHFRLVLQARRLAVLPEAQEDRF
ncbi:MAG TPA: hypothetical protein VGH02_05660 [Rhizomicrobium sp.]|jgi:hypothetical protein